MEDDAGRHFVLAADGSRHSGAAAVVADRLARLSNTPLTVVSDTLRAHSKERRRDATRHRRPPDVPPQAGRNPRTGRYPRGRARPDELIMQTAHAHYADLIVLGSHGRTGLERILLGSTIERVLDRTACAVLVVKAA